MAKYLAALDQGTTSSRTVIFTEEGQVVSSFGQEFPQHYPKPGWVEHDPRDILDSGSPISGKPPSCGTGGPGNASETRLSGNAAGPPASWTAW